MRGGERESIRATERDIETMSREQRVVKEIHIEDKKERQGLTETRDMLKNVWNTTRSQREEARERERDRDREGEIERERERKKKKRKKRNRESERERGSTERQGK